jgi:hypothetical protein
MLIVDSQNDQEFDWSEVNGSEDFQKEWEMLENFNES